MTHLLTLSNTTVNKNHLINARGISQYLNCFDFFWVICKYFLLKFVCFLGFRILILLIFLFLCSFLGPPPSKILQRLAIQDGEMFIYYAKSRQITRICTGRGLSLEKRLLDFCKQTTFYNFQEYDCTISRCGNIVYFTFLIACVNGRLIVALVIISLRFFFCKKSIQY